MQVTTIRLGDGYICVEPSYPEILPNKLKYWHRSLEWSEQRMARISTGHYEELATVSQWIDPETQELKQRLVTPFTGLMHRIRTVLRESGWDYKIVDERTALPKPDIYGACTHLREYQYEGAYKAIMSYGGVVCAPTGFGKTALIAAMIKAFPREQLQLRGTPLIVVSVPDKEINLKNYNDFVDPKLNFLPGREVGLVMSGHNRFSDDVQVITMDSLHRINPEDVGVFIADEVHSAASAERTLSIQKMTKAVKWGVSATPDGRFDGRDLVTEGLFGPVVYSCTYAEAVKFGALVPITVYWVDCPEPTLGIDKYMRFKTREGKYRHGVWRNNARNEVIGQLMRDIPDTMQTLCIMQRLDHMNSLVPLCGPGTSYVHGNTSAEEMIVHPNLRAISNQERAETYRSMNKGEISKILSTHIYKQGVNFPELEIVINAGGGGSDIVAKQIPGRESRKTETKTRSILIDFQHRWDVSLNDRGREVAGPIFSDDKAREKAYTQLGFEQIWVKDLSQIPFLKK